jgi:glycosyltransferase involved in cell wall biosynthesis
MRIAYLSISRIPSRTANSIHVMRMCRALASLQHEVCLLAPDLKPTDRLPDDIYEYYGVEHSFEIIRCRYPPIRGGDLVYARNCRKMLDRIQPRLVYGRSVTGCSAAARSGFMTCFEAHVPMSMRPWHERIAYRSLVRRESFRRLIVISAVLRQLYAAHDPETARTAIVAHDGADLETVRGIALQLPGPDLKVGYVGHLYPGRGIEIIAQLAEQMPEVGFHVVGGSEKDLALWAGRAGPPNLFFHGYVEPSEVHRYRAACDILIAPYQRHVTIQGRNDTSAFMSPLKVFEYMASSRAIVASDLPVLREVLSAENAILVPPDDLAAWRRAIGSLRDPGRREQIARKARDKFERNFTWECRARRIIAGIGIDDRA